MAASTAVGRLVLAAGDVDLIHRLRALLGRPGGPDVEVCQDAASALATLRGEPSLAALVGPPLSTLAFLSELRRAHPDLPIVALAEEADVYAAVEAMRAGASDYLLVRDLARLPELLTALSAEGRVAVEGGAEARSRRERWESEREVLQTAMANTGAHIAYLDADFNFVLANEAYCRGGGYSLDELVGHNHFALFAHAENEEIFRRVRDTGEPYFAYARPFRYPHRPDLGTTYWDWSLVPVRGSDGRVRGLVLSLMDVTEKGRLARENEEQRAALEAANAELQRANEELRASEGRYRLLFEHMTEEVHYWELIRDDEGRVCSWRLVDANPPVLRSWGKRLEDIRGRTTEEIFGPQETTRYLAAIQEADAEGVPHTVEVYHPDRDQRFRVTLVPLGEHLMVTGIDLTEVVRAQEALKREQELLQAIYDAIPVMLTVYDPRLERISLSRHVEHVTG